MSSTTRIRDTASSRSARAKRIGRRCEPVPLERLVFALLVGSSRWFNPSVGRVGLHRPAPRQAPLTIGGRQARPPPSDWLGSRLPVRRPEVPFHSRASSDRSSVVSVGTPRGPAASSRPRLRNHDSLQPGHNSRSGPHRCGDEERCCRWTSDSCSRLSGMMHPLSVNLLRRHATAPSGAGAQARPSASQDPRSDRRP